jgi:beta-N-acetylhexosaminidase
MKDLIPFEKMIRAGLLGLMPAHVIYTEIDDKPAGFSSIWLEGILREQLKFHGAIFSDDLSMKGAEVMGSYPQRAEAALSAGCDMVLACNNQAGAISILNEAKIQSNIELQPRLIRMHGRFEKNMCELKKTALWQERSAVILNFDEK